jgi:hypothetical protein
MSTIKDEDVERTIKLLNDLSARYSIQIIPAMAEIISRHMQSERDETRKALGLASKTITRILGYAGEQPIASMMLADRNNLKEAITAINAVLEKEKQLPEPPQSS